MKRRISCIHIIVLLTLVPILGIAQSSQYLIDSLEAKSSAIKSDSAYVSTLMSYVWDHARLDRTVSFHFLDRVEKYADSIKMSYKRDKMIYYRGVLLKNERSFAESEKYFKKFQKIKVEKNDTQWMAACHNVLLNLYSDMDLHEKASIEADKAIRLYELTKDTIGIVRVGSRIGTLLTQFGNTDTGMEYVRNAYKLGENISDYATYAYVINDMGYGYELQGKLDSAQYYYSKFKDYSKAHNLVYNEGFASFNLGTVFQKKGELDNALTQVRYAIKVADKFKDKSMQNSARLLAAEILGKQDRYEEAFAVIKDVDESNLELEDLVSKSSLYYEYHKKKNNLKEALVYHEQWKAYNDSLRSVKIIEAINEVEAKYETAKKDQEIETLALKDELNQTRISGRNKWIAFLGLGLAGLGFLLYRIFKQNKLITAQKDDLSLALNDKNVLLKEIHHRVKNNLQVISSLLGLQSRYVKDDVAQDALRVSKSRVQSMALLHQKLYGNKDLKSVNVKQYYIDLVENLISTYSIDESKIKFEVDVDDLNLDIDTIVPIGLITNELISNALKHAFTDQEYGNVYISLKEKAAHYELIVRDNGKGLPFTELPQKSGSLGIQLIKSFTEKLEGTVSVSSDGGAIFTITLAKP